MSEAIPEWLKMTADEAKNSKVNEVSSQVDVDVNKIKSLKGWDQIVRSVREMDQMQYIILQSRLTASNATRDEKWMGHVLSVAKQAATESDKLDSSAKQQSRLRQ